MGSHFWKALTLGREGVPDPVDLRVIAPHFGHREHVEPDAKLGEFLALLEELMSSPDQADLLAGVDAGRRSAEPVARPGTHLGDDQNIPVTGNDVELSKAA